MAMANEMESHIQFLNHKGYFLNGFQSGCLSSHQIKFLCRDSVLEFDCLPLILLSSELRKLLSELIYRNLDLVLSLPEITSRELELFMKIVTNKLPKPQEMNIFQTVANTLMVDDRFLEGFSSCYSPVDDIKSEDFEPVECIQIVDPEFIDEPEESNQQLVYFEPDLSYDSARQDDDYGKMAVKKAACASCYQDPQYAHNPRRVKSLCDLCQRAVCGIHVVKSCMACHQTDGVVEYLGLEQEGGLLEKKTNCSSCLLDPNHTRKPRRVRSVCQLCARPACGIHIVKSCVACRSTSQQLINTSDVEFEEEDLEGLPDVQENERNVETILNPSSVEKLKSLKRKLTGHVS